MDTRKHLMELLRDFDAGMLVTQDETSAALRSRPMHVAQIESNGDLWFLTDRDAHMVQEIRRNENVLVTFQDGKKRFISLSGRARLVVEDRNKLDELWQEAYRVWFPGGKEDERITLLQVRSDDAEYWDNAGLQKISQAFQGVQALASGKRPEAEHPRQFAHVELRK